MAGLESIALAVAHLEREGAHQSKYVDNEFFSSGDKEGLGDEIKRSTDKVPQDVVPASFSMPPPRRGFEERAPRTVSADSTHGFSDTSPRFVSTDWSRCDGNARIFTDSRQGFDEKAPRTVSAEFNSPTSDVQVCQSLQFTGGVASTLQTDLSSCLAEPELDAPLPPAPSSSDVFTQVLESDVLCGRGGETNHHPGNVKYRALVKRFQPLYIVSKRRDKPRIAEKIVRTIRQRGGRFLKKDSNSNTWRDVGNTKAREKTSQALREGAPELRSTPPKGKEEPVSQPNIIMNNLVVPSMPSIVETEPGDIVRFVSPAPKRRRLNIAELATAATSSTDIPPALASPTSSVGVSEGIPEYTSPALASANGMEAVVSSSHYAHKNINFGVTSPAGFSATVSADDEDFKSEDQHSIRSTRGPRLKLLKKRLQHDRKL